MTLKSAIRWVFFRPIPKAEGYFRALRPFHAEPNGSRVVYARLEKIRGILEAGTPFNATTLSKESGCGRKAIGRDIQFLRSQGMHITFDQVKHTFRLEKEAA